MLVAIQTGLGSGDDHLDVDLLLRDLNLDAVSAAMQQQINRRMSSLYALDRELRNTLRKERALKNNSLIRPLDGYPQTRLQ